MLILPVYKGLLKSNVKNIRQYNNFLDDIAKYLKAKKNNSTSLTRLKNKVQSYINSEDNGLSFLDDLNREANSIKDITRIDKIINREKTAMNYYKKLFKIDSTERFDQANNIYKCALLGNALEHIKNEDDFKEYKNLLDKNGFYKTRYNNIKKVVQKLNKEKTVKGLDNLKDREYKFYRTGLKGLKQIKHSQSSSSLPASNTSTNKYLSNERADIQNLKKKKSKMKSYIMLWNLSLAAGGFVFSVLSTIISIIGLGLLGIIGVLISGPMIIGMIIMFAIIAIIGFLFMIMSLMQQPLLNLPQKFDLYEQYVPIANNQEDFETLNADDNENRHKMQNFVRNTFFKDSGVIGNVTEKMFGGFVDGEIDKEQLIYTLTNNQIIKARQTINTCSKYGILEDIQQDFFSTKKEIKDGKEDFNKGIKEIKKDVTNLSGDIKTLEEDIKVINDQLLNINNEFIRLQNDIDVFNELFNDFNGEIEEINYTGNIQRKEDDWYIFSKEKIKTSNISNYINDIYINKLRSNNLLTELNINTTYIEQIKEDEVDFYKYKVEGIKGGDDKEEKHNYLNKIKEIQKEYNDRIDELKPYQKERQEIIKNKGKKLTQKEDEKINKEKQLAAKNNSLNNLKYKEETLIEDTATKLNNAGFEINLRELKNQYNDENPENNDKDKGADKIEEQLFANLFDINTLEGKEGDKVDLFNGGVGVNITYYDWYKNKLQDDNNINKQVCNNIEDNIIQAYYKPGVKKDNKIQCLNGTCREDGEVNKKEMVNYFDILHIDDIFNEGASKTYNGIERSNIDIFLKNYNAIASIFNQLSDLTIMKNWLSGRFHILSQGTMGMEIVGQEGVVNIYNPFHFDRNEIEIIEDDNNKVYGSLTAPNSAEKIDLSIFKGWTYDIGQKEFSTTKGGVNNTDFATINDVLSEKSIIEYRVDNNVVKNQCNINGLNIEDEFDINITLNQNKWYSQAENAIDSYNSCRDSCFSLEEGVGECIDDCYDKYFIDGEKERKKNDLQNTLDTQINSFCGQLEDYTNKYKGLVFDINKGPIEKEPSTIKVCNTEERVFYNHRFKYDIEKYSTNGDKIINTMEDKFHTDNDIYFPFMYEMKLPYKVCYTLDNVYLTEKLHEKINEEGGKTDYYKDEYLGFTINSNVNINLDLDVLTSYKDSNASEFWTDYQLYKSLTKYSDTDINTYLNSLTENINDVLEVAIDNDYDSFIDTVSLGNLYNIDSTRNKKYNFQSNDLRLPMSKGEEDIDIDKYNFNTTTRYGSREKNIGNNFNEKISLNRFGLKNQPTFYEGEDPDSHIEYLKNIGGDGAFNLKTNLNNKEKFIDTYSNFLIGARQENDWAMTNAELNKKFGGLKYNYIEDSSNPSLNNIDDEKLKVNPYRQSELFTIGNVVNYLQGQMLNLDIQELNTNYRQQNLFFPGTKGQMLSYYTYFNYNQIREGYLEKTYGPQINTQFNKVLENLKEQREKINEKKEDEENNNGILNKAFKGVSNMTKKFTNGVQNITDDITDKTNNIVKDTGNRFKLLFGDNEIEALKNRCLFSKDIDQCLVSEKLHMFEKEDEYKEAFEDFSAAYNKSKSGIGKEDIKNKDIFGEDFSKEIRYMNASSEKIYLNPFYTLFKKQTKEEKKMYKEVGVNTEITNLGSDGLFDENKMQAFGGKGQFENLVNQFTQGDQKYNKVRTIIENLEFPMYIGGGLDFFFKENESNKLGNIKDVDNMLFEEKYAIIKPELMLDFKDFYNDYYDSLYSDGTNVNFNVNLELFDLWFISLLSNENYNIEKENIVLHEYFNDIMINNLDNYGDEFFDGFKRAIRNESLREEIYLEDGSNFVSNLIFDTDDKEKAKAFQEIMIPIKEYLNKEMYVCYNEDYTRLWFSQGKDNNRCEQGGFKFNNLKQNLDLSEKNNRNTKNKYNLVLNFLVHSEYRRGLFPDVTNKWDINDKVEPNKRIDYDYAWSLVQYIDFIYELLSNERYDFFPGRIFDSVLDESLNKNMLFIDTLYSLKPSLSNNYGELNINDSRILKIFKGDNIEADKQQYKRYAGLNYFFANTTLLKNLQDLNKFINSIENTELEIYELVDFYILEFFINQDMILQNIKYFNNLSRYSYLKRYINGDGVIRFEQYNVFDRLANLGKDGDSVGRYNAVDMGDYQFKVLKDTLEGDLEELDCDIIYSEDDEDDKEKLIKECKNIKEELYTTNTLIEFKTTMTKFADIFNFEERWEELGGFALFNYANQKFVGPGWDFRKTDLHKSMVKKHGKDYMYEFGSYPGQCAWYSNFLTFYKEYDKGKSFDRIVGNAKVWCDKAENLGYNVKYTDNIQLKDINIGDVFVVDEHYGHGYQPQYGHVGSVIGVDEKSQAVLIEEMNYKDIYNNGPNCRTSGTCNVSPAEFIVTRRWSTDWANESKCFIDTGNFGWDVQKSMEGALDE